MRLKIKKLKFLTGRPVCIIHENTAKKMSLHEGNRVLISKKDKKIVSVVDTISSILSEKEIAASDEIIKLLSLKPGQLVNVEISERPHSIEIIKEKLKGKRLTEKEIREIIENIANNSLTEIEVAFFVSAVYEEGMSLNETKYLIKAMVETGNKIKFNGHVIDKHSVGGVAGNRTTPILVSICAANDLVMPKTSSRAITSGAGTADVIETVAKVDFSLEEIKEIVKKTNGCFVWGGSLGLAPVDDKIIRIEKIVNIDSSSQVIASILSKKISVGSKYILIDIPCGRSAKFSKSEAIKLKQKFLKIGKLFNLKILVVLTDGSEPIGNGIGPLFEMRDIIKVLKRQNPPKDLEKRSIFLAGKILEFCGKANKGDGEKIAKKTLNSGLAFKKFLEIIKAQKGNINKISRIKSKFSYDIKGKNARIKHIDNKMINELARLAGCPEDKAAGIYIHEKKNDYIKNEKILTIHSISKEKLKHAIDFYNKNKEKVIEFQ